MTMRGQKLFLLLFVTSLVACRPAPTGGEENWMVMGTTASLKWDGLGDEDAPTATKVRDAFARIETLLNAHDPASELSRLATLSDDEILAKCSPAVRPCYEAAFRLREQTDGLFNPRWKGSDTMDLGAIAKGFAVDCAATPLSACDRSGSWRILIDLGGNLKAVGSKGWRVGVKDGESFVLEPGQACATSATYYRGNHIHDGRTGVAMSNSVYSVTVIHPSSAMLADGLSTVMFLLGRERGEEFLKNHYPEAKACWISGE